MSRIELLNPAGVLLPLFHEVEERARGEEAPLSISLPARPSQGERDNSKASWVEVRGRRVDYRDVANRRTTEKMDKSAEFCRSTRRFELEDFVKPIENIVSPCKY